MFGNKCYVLLLFVISTLWQRIVARDFKGSSNPYNTENAIFGNKGRDKYAFQRTFKPHSSWLQARRSLSNENAIKRSREETRKEAFVLSNPRPSDENVDHLLDSAHNKKSIKLLPLVLLSNTNGLASSKNRNTFTTQGEISRFHNITISEDGRRRALKLKEITNSYNHNHQREGDDLNDSTTTKDENTDQASVVGNLGDKIELPRNRQDDTKGSLNEFDKTSLKELKMLLGHPTEEIAEERDERSKYKLRRINSESLDQSKEELNAVKEEPSISKDSGTSFAGNLEENYIDILKDGNSNNNSDQKTPKHKDSGLLIDKNSNFFIENKWRHSEDWSQPNQDGGAQQQQQATTNTIVKPINEDIKAPVENDHHKQRPPGDQSLENNDLQQGKPLKLIARQESADSKPSGPAPKPKPIDVSKPSQSNPSKRPTGMVEVNEDQKLTSTSNVDNKPNPDDERKPDTPSNGGDENKMQKSAPPAERPTTVVEVDEAKQITSTSYMDNKPVASFSYNPESPYGPSTWHLLNPSWTCRSRKQSPINIDTSSVMQNHLAKNVMTKLIPEGKPLIGTLKNNGHSPTFTLSADSPTVRLFGATLNNDYFLKQFHFHFGCDSSMGSEHSVDGVSFPLEMHLVFWDNSSYTTFPQAAKGDRGIAVVSVLFQLQIGKISDIPEEMMALSKISTILPRIEEEGDGMIVPEDFNLRFEPLFPSVRMLDKADRFYVYDGSLSTPGCYESVVWIVMATHPYVSEDQLSIFRKLKSSKVSSTGMMCNNFRPIQKRFGRKVYSNII